MSSFTHSYFNDRKAYDSFKTKKFMIIFCRMDCKHALRRTYYVNLAKIFSWNKKTLYPSYQPTQNCPAVEVYTACTTVQKACLFKRFVMGICVWSEWALRIHDHENCKSTFTKYLYRQEFFKSLPQRTCVRNFVKIKPRPPPRRGVHGHTHRNIFFPIPNYVSKIKYIKICDQGSDL